MSDITKCANAEQCPIKNTCYRNLAEEAEFQSWASFFDPNDPDPKQCEHYWEYPA